MNILVSCDEAGRLDAATRELAALEPNVLMETAALRLWDRLAPLAASLGEAAGEGADRGARPIVALCGSGNNAGDALALLRQARFSGRRDLAAVLGRAEPGPLAASQLASIRALGLPALSWESEPEACVRLMRGALLLVDGIAGSGLRGPLREPLASLARAANASGSPIASLDLPSGLGDGEIGDIVRARWTLSIEPRKACLYRPAARLSCGEIIPVTGVFPVDAAPRRAARLLEAGDLGILAPAPAVSAHKGLRGRLAVFAGARGTEGAAALASRAALAAGAGLVALHASDDVRELLAAKLDEVMVRTGSLDKGLFDASRWDAVLAGPGWGMGHDRMATLETLLGLGLPAVLDADAIGLYAELRSRGFVPAAPLVLTPHPGEFETLAGVPPSAALDDPAAVLPGVASRFGATIVLKSHITWVASPAGELSVWEGLENALAAAGSGDVLAGLAGGLLAAAFARYHLPGNAMSATGDDTACQAACGAVVAHGLAGRAARARHGWFAAGQLAPEAARILGALA